MARKEAAVTKIKREVAIWPETWNDERIDRVFRDMFRGFFGTGAMFDRLFDGTHGFLRVEEYVEDNSCVIRAELPGIDPDKDVEVTVEDGILHIRAHREERSEDTKPAGYRSEFRYGSFERAVLLPDGITETDLKATYKNGVLEVRVPMPVEKKMTSTKVPIDH